MKELEIGLLYISLHNQLKIKFGVNRIISRKEFFCKLGKHGQVPKPMRAIVLKEMEFKKLLKQVDRNNIQILPCDIDLEKDQDKLYRLCGIY